MEHMEALYKCRVCGGTVLDPLSESPRSALKASARNLESSKITYAPSRIPASSILHVCLRSLFAGKVFEEKLGICDFIGYYGTRAATEEEKQGTGP